MILDRKQEELAKQKEAEKSLSDSGSSKDSDEEDEVASAGDLSELKRGKVTSARKVYDGGSTIAPSEIRKKLMTVRGFTFNNNILSVY